MVSLDNVLNRIRTYIGDPKYRAKLLADFLA